MTHRYPFDSEHIHAYIDDELSSDERSEIELAAADDAALRQELLELQATATLLSTLPEFTPRRSFTLGQEYAKPTPISAGKVVRLLPIMRSLSVAAAIMFMVIGGALFLDINGDSTSDAGQTRAQQDVIMGVTDSSSQASHDAEDASENSADQGLVSRGETASAQEAPVESLPVEAPAAVADETNARAVDTTTDQDDHTNWILSLVILGGAVLVTGGTWYALSQREQSVTTS